MNEVISIAARLSIAVVHLFEEVLLVQMLVLEVHAARGAIETDLMKMLNVIDKINFTCERLRTDETR